MTHSPLLHAPIPPSLRTEWAEHLARPPYTTEEGESLVMVFRLGAERFALPIECIREVAPVGVIRPVPHAREGNILGITNIHGQIRLCIRMDRILQVLPSPASAQSRLLVLMGEGWRVAAVVDEVLGVEAISESDQLPLPSTHAGTVHGKFWLGKWNAALLDAPAFIATLRARLR